MPTNAQSSKNDTQTGGSDFSQLSTSQVELIDIVTHASVDFFCKMRARRHRTRARSRRSPLAGASSEQLANHMALPWMEQVREVGGGQNFRQSGINAGSERPRQLKLGVS